MTLFRLTLLFLLGILLWQCQKNTSGKAILVFSKTNGFRHASIEPGVAALQLLGEKHGFKVQATEDSSFITEENLQNFGAVVFLSTSGDVLNNRQQADMQRFIEAGGGFVGIHGAAATEYDWKWYGHLVGAVFDGHPAIQQGKVQVVEQGHPATAHLPAVWERTDEWYNFKPVAPADKVLLNAAASDTVFKDNPNVPVQVRWQYDGRQPFLGEHVKVLLTVDETSYKGGKHGDFHPVAWQQDFSGGRSFYTSLGHNIESYSDPLFLNHLLGGIMYALGTKALDYKKAKTHRIPASERFVRTILASNLDEPMELEIFPDGKIMIVERKGAIKIYDPVKESLETVCLMPVYHEFEEGLLGVALDPKWEENHWVYLYYSLMEGGRRNRLSRFVFKDNMLHLGTEKMLLEVPEINGCCHAGGSVEFDKKRGLLYLSTGDNTNPFESDGFAPIDERPGRALWDAQKSAANANDLRGKILRIKPEPDGTYSIPEGNLFPPGLPGTRPEIFVMGCRNPFRISIDSETGCLYWGDVGPDAGRDGHQRGSKGYDTWNRACGAGNHGWPFVRGNHIYFDYDFAKRKSGPMFDTERPLNDSPFNTGIQELPSVQPPLIWYSYDESLEFPWVGTGGKNPMAGPVFHASDLPEGVNIFPPYFENKLFVYEWMRNWIYVVTLDEDGKYVQSDPFLPEETFVRPMDMAFGPDGALYVLEYGEQWFARNIDARLNKIEFAPGNRKPVAKIEASPSVGANPLTVRFSASGSYDYDNDPLNLQWKLTGGPFKSNASSFNYTFEKPGIYEMALKVTDPSGAYSTISTTIKVGNNTPSVSWELAGNQSFYWDEDKIEYRLKITDAEDGSLEDGTLDPARVRLSIDYLPEGKDLAAIILGHQTQNSAASLQHAAGRLLVENNDCKTCHAEDRHVNGPSYADIASRYFGDTQAINYLSRKVMEGGAGVWGETAMSAHPNLTKKEAEEIVRYILSLAGDMQSRLSVPFEGTYDAEAHIGKEEKGAYIFQASYIDKGGADGQLSLSAKSIVALRYPKMDAGSYSKASIGVRKGKDLPTNMTFVRDLFDGRFIGYDDIDLTGIGAVKIGLLEGHKVLADSKIEIRLDGPSGRKIAQKDLILGVNEFSIPIEKTNGKHSIFVVFLNEKNKEQEIARPAWFFFEKERVQ